MKTGIGYDIHRLVAGRKLVLGGVEIDHELGLEGHSDADVICHAVCDAVLGAAALGDIGLHFPDTDSRYSGMSSLKLLAEVREKITEKSYEINNVDVTVICEEPRIQEYIPEMIKNISQSLEAPAYDINIKATTNENVGPVGKKEAIASMAVATIIPVPA